MNPLDRFEVLDARDPDLTLEESAERDRCAVEVVRGIVKWAKRVEASGALERFEKLKRGDLSGYSDAALDKVQPNTARTVTDPPWNAPPRVGVQRVFSEPDRAQEVGMQWRSKGVVSLRITPETSDVEGKRIFVLTGMATEAQINDLGLRRRTG